MIGYFGGLSCFFPQHSTVIGDQSNDVGSIIKYRGDPPQMAYEQHAEAQRRLNRRQMGSQMGLVQDQMQYQQSLQQAMRLQSQILQKTKELSMFGEFKADIRSFIKEHKSIIYWIVLLYVADKFLFEGKFKVKINEILHRLVGKMDSKLDEIGAVVKSDAK